MNFRRFGEQVGKLVRNAAFDKDDKFKEECIPALAGALHFLLYVGLQDGGFVCNKPGFINRLRGLEVMLEEVLTEFVGFMQPTEKEYNEYVESVNKTFNDLRSRAMEKRENLKKQINKNRRKK